MKSSIEELVLDTELIATLIVADSPVTVVPALTTINSCGGRILGTARMYVWNEDEQKR
jgi:hypothetical protein